MAKTASVCSWWRTLIMGTPVLDPGFESWRFGPIGGRPRSFYSRWCRGEDLIEEPNGIEGLLPLAMPLHVVSETPLEESH